ncbi:MAG TPA: response regulator [Tissierellaceae bacterium]|nr:response regulator [Tissierellaceae bacterium]
MIIIIDDNKDLAYITGELLKVSGYETTVIDNGEEGVKKAKELDPKVILCDIGMDGMNGYDVARYIRKDDDLKDIYLIAISGYSSEEDRKESERAGFDVHLGKPIDMEELKEILEEVYND